MRIELGKFGDGGLMLLSDSAFPHQIRRVEYYRDQKLILLVYDEDPELEGELMHYEVSDVAKGLIENNASILIVSCAPNRKLYGYDVSLVKV